MLEADLEAVEVVAELGVVVEEEQPGQVVHRTTSQVLWDEPGVSGVREVGGCYIPFKDGLEDVELLIPGEGEVEDGPEEGAGGLGDGGRQGLEVDGEDGLGLRLLLHTAPCQPSSCLECHSFSLAMSTSIKGQQVAKVALRSYLVYGLLLRVVVDVVELARPGLPARDLQAVAPHVRPQGGRQGPPWGGDLHVQTCKLISTQTSVL